MTEPPDLRHNPPYRHPMKKLVLSLATAGLLAFAAALQVSRFTVYNYLDRVERSSAAG